MFSTLVTRKSTSTDLRILQHIQCVFAKHKVMRSANNKSNEKMTYKTLMLQSLFF